MAPGEVLATTGESGSGKSTVLNILGLMDSDFSGSVKIKEHDIKTLTKRKQEEFIRNHVNYLFQNYALIADEPTGNLDCKNSEYVFDCLKEQATKDKAVIMVTNEDNFLDSCNKGKLTIAEI